MFKAFSSTFLTSHGFLSRFEPVGNPFNRRLTLAAMSTFAVKHVGTHDGRIHCDEALSCFLIRLTEKFSNAHIVRTRDPEHFGKEIIANMLGVDIDHPDVQRLFQLVVYKNFVEEINAVDNGIDQCDTNETPRYLVNSTLSTRVGMLNLQWNDPDQSSEKENEAFERAMALTGREFMDNVRAKIFLPAQSIVMRCLEARFDVDPSGEIMVVDRYCPWEYHLFELEEEMKINPLIKYVVYEDDDPSKCWIVEAVPIAPHRFERRKALPAQWRVSVSVSDEELCRVSGIPGGVFIHMSGFICGNQTFDGALAMAKAALTL